VRGKFDDIQNVRPVVKNPNTAKKYVNRFLAQNVGYAKKY
jgi:hypothetical protein